MARDRKTIGVLISIIDGFYQSELWSGVSHEAETNDHNVLLFCGMSLFSPIGTEIQDNAIYTLLNKERINGLIIETGTIANYLNEDDFIRFIDRYKPIPVLSLSIDIKDHCSIVLDNKRSMSKMIEHVIGHGFRDIAFVTGPLSNTEAILRFEAYKEVLKKHNIPYRDEYVYKGNFSQISGQAAVVELIKVRKLMPDLIVFSNDEMAIGGAIELEHLDLPIPSAIRITGFDDVENAKSFTVPLTTVKQPFFKMGQIAVDKISQLIDGEKNVANESLMGDLVIRNSCGCFNLLPDQSEHQATLFQFFDQDIKYDFESFGETISNNIRDIAIVLTLILSPKRDEKEIIRAFVNVLEGLVFDLHIKEAEGGFVKSIYRMVKKYHILHYDLEWHGLIYSITTEILKINMTEELYKFMSNVLLLTSLVTSNMLVRKELNKEYRYKELYFMTSRLIHETSMVLSKNELFKIVKRVVGENKFSKIYVCLFDEYIDSGSGIEVEYPEFVNMVFGYNDGWTVENRKFRTEEMLPDSLLYTSERQELIFFSLHFQNKHFGYIVADMNSVRNTIFKTLRELICNTLSQLVLLDNLEAYNEQLRDSAVKDSMTLLYNRRGFYQLGSDMYRRSLRKNKPLAAIFGDLDKLKIINDTLGHESGDQAIKTVAKVLEKIFPKDAVIARVGGDEFVILLDTQIDQVEAFISKIQVELETYNNNSGLNFNVAMSFGYAIYDDDNYASLDDLIKAADQKLYINKHENHKKYKNRGKLFRR